MRELSPEAYITTDVGQHQMWAAQYLRNSPRKWISSAGLGTMGFGLPAAIGVKAAFPNSDVICIAGDASVLMNIQELGTLSQYGLKVKLIIINNRWQGMVMNESVISLALKRAVLDSIDSGLVVGDAWVAGDASVLMNIQELGTLSQYGLKVKLIIINNRWQGMVRQWQESFYDERYSSSDMSCGEPDFVKLAESFGVKGYLINDRK